MKTKTNPLSALCLVMALIAPTLAAADGYTEIYNAPPTGAAVRSFLPFKLHYDMSGKYLLTALYVDSPTPEPPPPPQNSDSAAPNPSAPANIEEPRIQHQVLFAFNSSTISRTADKAIRRAAQDAKQANQTIVIGRADTIGTESFNATLSQARAQKVARRLMQYGVSRDAIREEYLGKTAPSVECSNIRNRSKRIQCEAPNRATLINIY